jgi:hypothetical protein
MTEDTRRAAAAMSDADSSNEDRERFALDHVKSSLTEEIDHGREDVEHAVDDALKKYDEAEVRDFVPILVERDVREEFREE